MGCVDRCKEPLSERDWHAEETNESEKNRQELFTGRCMHGQKHADCRHCAAGKGQYG